MSDISEGEYQSYYDDDPHTPTSQAVTPTEPRYCRHESEGELPYLCTLPLHHAGDFHVARGSDDEMLHRWPIAALQGARCECGHPTDSHSSNGCSESGCDCEQSTLEIKAYARGYDVSRLRIASLSSQLELARDSAAEYEAERNEAGALAKDLASQLERLTEWKNSVLNSLESKPDFVAGEWAGDKRGWGYVFEYINWIHRELERLTGRYDRIIEALDLDEPVVRSLQESLEEAQARASENSESLERLKAEQITPAEARLALHAIEAGGYGATITMPLCQKLQRLGSDTGAQP